MVSNKRRSFLKKAAATAGAVSVGSLAGCTGGEDDDGDGVIEATFGTAAGGGAFQVIGSGLAEIWNRSDRIDINPVTTGGSLDNVARMGEGEIEIGLMDGYQVWMAMNGEAAFDQEYSLNSIMRLYTNYNWFVVREDSGMTTIDDLDGASVGAGAQGSGANWDTELFLEDIAGLDINPQFMGFSEAANAIADEQLDSMLVYGLLPAVQELAEQTDIRPLEWGRHMDELRDLPYIIEVEFPTFVDWWDEPLPMPANDIFITATDDLPEEASYEIVDQTFTNIEESRNVFSQLDQLELELAPRDIDGVVPLHPGAERYYEEEGVL